MSQLSAAVRRIGAAAKALCCSAALLVTLAFPAAAAVERIEILDRAILAEGKSFGNVGAYERLRGRLYFALEAADAENQSIVDIRLAPRDAQGRVTFTADFVLLKPLDPARGNGRLLYEVNNRGNLHLLNVFNDAVPANLPATAADAGNGFLMEQGYAMLWTGWSWDVAPGDNRLRADLPLASDGGKPIFGRTSGEIAVNRAANSARHMPAGTVGYEPLNPADPNDVLTVRESALGLRTVVARSRWQFGYEAGGRVIYDPAMITLEGGFRPGAIYALTYTVRGPRVAGLGLAGIRDALLFFRYERADRFGAPNPLIAQGGALPLAAFAVGHAQAARALQAMVYQGLAADGRGRMAFDGVLLNMAGGGRGGFNARFAQPNRHFSPDLELDFPSDLFPFATAPQTDPLTQATASVLDRAEALNAVPKLVYINTPTEYWVRSASLTHTDTEGAADLAPDRRTRIYMIAGAQHRLGAPGGREDLAHCGNPLDQRPLLRAMLLHLDAWVTLKKEPPPSATPTLAGKTLGKLNQYLEKFPQIPGMRTPTRLLEPPRLDFGARFAAEGIADIVPPRAGRPFTTLVPLADSDGLDLGGIRLPELSVPLGTYTGWNPQNAATGAPERLARHDGSFVPFVRTENDRIATGDPRPSIQERYATREAYTKAYAAAALELAEKEMILGNDINPMVERAGAFYDRLMAHSPEDESCSYLAVK